MKNIEKKNAQRIIHMYIPCLINISKGIKKAEQQQPAHRSIFIRM